MFLDMSLGFRQEWQSEAEYLAMWSFGLMHLFIFTLATAKSLIPWHLKKLLKGPGLWTDIRSTLCLSNLSSQAICVLRQASVTPPCFRVTCSEMKVRNTLFKWKLGFLCLVLEQGCFTVGGYPTTEDSWSKSFSAGESGWAGGSDCFCSVYVKNVNNVCMMGTVGSLRSFWNPAPFTEKKELDPARCWQKYSLHWHTELLLLLLAFKSHQPSCSTLNHQL